MIHVVRVKTIKGPDLRGEGVLSASKQFLSDSTLKRVETARVYRLEGTTKQEAKQLAETLFCESINQIYSLNEPILDIHPRGAPQALGSEVRARRAQHHLGGGRLARRSLGEAGMDSPEVNVIEIAYKPGVMNPEVASIIKAAKDLGIEVKAADASTEYGFYGKLSKEKLQQILGNLNLYNNTVEHIVKEEPRTLAIKGRSGKTTTIPIHNMSDDELMLLSKDKLFLNLEEMKVIQKYFQKMKRDPTDCEIETLAQTWSEHSGHKTFKALLTVDGKIKEPLITRIKKEALKHNKHIVSAFVDNSGVMDFYDGWAICGKGETHNSPSAIEPYGGAMTGSGGVFRDVVGTGLGGKTIVSTDVFCLGPWNLPDSKLPPGCLPPGYILRRVVQAVRDYGNRMGIPTNNGSLHFHEDFRAKPTVFVGAYGILPKKYAKKGKPKVGDSIVSIGGRVGRDGIHGATFSSGEMTERTITVNAQAVQIGNAIEEKRMFDAILEARDLGLIRAIQDSGGGGLSSAVGEMGEAVGVTVHLENERFKYQGLSPWETWLSESQERMILATPKNKFKKFAEVCKKYNVEVSNLGRFNGSKKLNVYYGKQKVCDLDMKFLHEGLPQRTMIARKITSEEPVQSPRRWPASPKLQRGEPNGLLRGGSKSEKEWITVLKKVLSHGNICSKEPIVRMYDHSVQGTNDLQPYSGVLHDGPNDAVVLRPLLHKPYGMIVSHGLNPILNRIDPYWGSIWAATEAVANYVAVGGNYKDASLINNYIWPFPDEESLWSLDRSVDAVVDFMRALKIPVISGKDSLSSTYRGKDGTVIKIPPVLCISVFGRIPNISKTVTADFKKEGSVICFVGKMDSSAIGGSTYFDVFKTPRGWPASQRGEPQDSPEVNRIPHVDLISLPQTLNAIYRGIQQERILSCHDVSEGGLITTLFEMCVGGDMGMAINLDVFRNTSDGGRLKRSASHDSSEVNRPDYLLFNETAGCFIVELEDERVAEKLFSRVPYIVLGKTRREKSMSVFNGKRELFAVDIAPLKRAWKEPMKKLFP